MEQIEGVVSLKDNISSVLSTIQGNMSRFSQSMAAARQETSIFENIKLTQKTVQVDCSQIQAAQANYAALSQAQSISLGVDVDASAMEAVRASMSAMQSQNFSMTVTETGIEATTQKLSALKDGADEAKTSMSAFEQIGKATGAMKSTASSLMSLIDNTKQAKSAFDGMKSPVEGAVSAFSALQDALDFGNGIGEVISSFRTMGTSMGFLQSSTAGADAAQKGLNASQAASPWGWVGLAISGVVAGVTLLQQHLEEINQPLTDTRDKLEEVAETYDSAMDAAGDNYNKQMGDLNAMLSGVENLDKLIQSGADSRQIDLVAQGLLTEFPALEGAIEKVNGLWQIQRQEVDKVVDAVEREIRAELARGELKAAISKEQDAEKVLQESQTAFKEAVKADEKGYADWQADVKDVSGNEQIVAQKEREVDRLNGMTYEQQEKYVGVGNSKGVDAYRMAVESANTELGHANAELEGAKTRENASGGKWRPYMQSMEESFADKREASAGVGVARENYNNQVNGNAAEEAKQNAKQEEQSILSGTKYADMMNAMIAPGIQETQGDLNQLQGFQQLIESGNASKEQIDEIASTLNTDYKAGISDDDRGNGDALQKSIGNLVQGLTVDTGGMMRDATKSVLDSMDADLVAKRAELDSVKKNTPEDTEKITSLEDQISVIETQKAALEAHSTNLLSAIESGNMNFETACGQLTAFLGGWTPKATLEVVLKGNTTGFEATFSGGGGGDGGGKENQLPPGVFAEADGTSYFPGGLTRINEKGDEMIELPTGSKVYPVQETGRQLQEISSGSAQPIVVNLYGTTIREDADITRIASELVERLERQRMIMV